MSDLLSPPVGILALKFVLVSVELLRLFLKHVLEGVVQKELLAEVVQLLLDELVELSHDRLKDSDTMSSD